MPERTPVERKTKMILEKVSSSYEEAFTTERRIIFTIDELLHYLRSNLDTPNYPYLDSVLDTFYSKLERLVDKRSAHRSEINQFLGELL
jgi:hypothetical protein